MDYKVSEEKLNEIYDDYCENDSEVASEKVQETYRKLDTAFVEYLTQVIEDNFKKGFRYALKLMERGTIA